MPYEPDTSGKGGVCLPRSTCHRGRHRGEVRDRRASVSCRRFRVGFAGEFGVRELHDGEREDEERDAGEDHADDGGPLVTGFEFGHLRLP